MKKNISGNMLIAQSGGPTVVINRSLIGAVLEAKKHKIIKKIYGARHGIKGILKEDFVNLSKEKLLDLNLIANTPSSALGSVRKKPSPEDCVKIFEVLKKHDIRYFFYIGGNDSAETTKIINDRAQAVGYELRCFHIPKTIDNDLRENDHTPGFGSAAKFVISAIMGINLDNRALPGVHISIIMGRHSGFLTASSALARVCPDDGPHLIYLPEQAFDMNQFVKDVQAVYKKYNRCIVAVSEGISDKTGTAIASKFSKEVDSHGNVQLSGSGSLGDLLVAEIKAKTDISRVRADTFGYLQRSFPGIVSVADTKEAQAVGATAVKAAVRGKPASGSIAIRRKPGKKYNIYYECVPLSSVARDARHMPPQYINKEGNHITKSFIEYLKPIVGDLPAIGRFSGI